MDSIMSLAKTNRASTKIKSKTGEYICYSEAPEEHCNYGKLSVRRH